MAVAMWKATKYASYILGDYEVKVLRENIKLLSMKTEQEGLLKSCLHQLLKKLLKRLQRKRLGLLWSHVKVVSNIFGKATKVLPSSHMLYVARQEGFEEMAEELFQDGETSGQCLWIINNAKKLEKEDTYNIWMTVILKMLQSVTLPLE
jgi:hypothetical protein